MQPPPIPQNEQERIKALNELLILDTPPEERFDKITREAVKKLKVPIAIISLVDKEREWFKSCAGVNPKEGPRQFSFCGHAMLSEYIFVVDDTLKDERFFDNPQVVGSPFIRFYAGVSLHNKRSGLPVGVFCIKDFKPRSFTAQEIHMLIELADQAEAEINKNLKL